MGIYITTRFPNNIIMVVVGRKSPLLVWDINGLGICTDRSVHRRYYCFTEYNRNRGWLQVAATTLSFRIHDYTTDDVVADSCSHCRRRRPRPHPCRRF